MAQHISLYTLVVRDYDEAIAFYAGKLGFELLEDTDRGGGKRWVRVRPPGATPSTTLDSAAVLLAKAVTPDQLTSIGRQTGGRVFGFIHTDDFARDHAAMLSRGVRFREPPRHEPYGTVAVFEDLYGNAWDLIEPRPTPDESTPTIEAFDACSIPLARWSHRAHLTIAYLLLQQLPLEQATDHMRRGVQKYNAAHDIAQTETGGYHETLTIAWMRILHTTMQTYNPILKPSTPNEFLQQHPHLLSKVLLRLYYSRPRIMSHQARHNWVEPDLAPLPAPPAA